MSVRNTIAAKAARREAKAERKSANALVSNYSPIKNLNMGKTNTIGVMVKVKTNSGVDSFIAFETDNEEFLPIYNVVRKRQQLEILNCIWGGDIVMHMEKQLPPNHDFSMLVLNFLCTTKYHQCIANNGGASFGIIVNLDETKNLAAVDLFEYKEWQTILKNMEFNFGATKICI
ncbi:MAG: hypothetical protein NT104_00180 [Bacteroidetes bacterium]|nr:hypothetical protein [Bacteroidota bacterium]